MQVIINPNVYLETVKKNAMNRIIEFISRLLDKELPQSKENYTFRKSIIDFLSLSEEAYVLIEWPEVQDYMEESWFDEEAKLSEGSSYFIPLKRLI